MGRKRGKPASSSAEPLKPADVLDFFERTSGSPLSFKDMVGRMELSSSESRQLKKTLRRLVADGAMVLTRRGLYGPSREMALVTGYFEAHRAGFGFVVQDKPATRDIFIPAGATAGAMNMDRVVARIENVPRRSGRIVRITQRSQKRVLGRVHMSEGLCFIKPRWRKSGFEVQVPQDECAEIAEGQNVLVEIAQYPTPTRPAIGRVVKALPEPSGPAADMEAVIEELGIPKRFPSPALREAEEASTRGLGQREDLRGLVTFTIDGEDAKDFDDAVSAMRTASGYTLWVHIADVSYFVAEGGALDAEALRRGTSVYFPGKVIPMLPSVLSEDVCSLRPQLDRAALTAEMEFGPEGNLRHGRFYPSLINSNERMTYASVRKILIDRDPEEREKYAHIAPDIDLMGELAEKLRTARIARGSLDLDLPEPYVILDGDGKPTDIIKAERSFAHMLIEEFMIAANESVASHLERKHLPCVYRIHEAPDTRKISEVMRVAGARIPLRKSLEPWMLRDALHKIKGSPNAEVVQYMVLRAMKQARYYEDNAGHFGLASECYCHFTSPIRRYPDLIVHRILREAISRSGMRPERVEAISAKLPEIAFGSSRTERVADEAEREALAVMRAWFMLEKVGETLDAHVTGITSEGIRVRLVKHYVDGFLGFSDLSDDFYIYDEKSITLKGRSTGKAFRLGTPLRLRVDGVVLDERRIIFGLA